MRCLQINKPNKTQNNFHQSRHHSFGGAAAPEKEYATSTSMNNFHPLVAIVPAHNQAHHLDWNGCWKVSIAIECQQRTHVALSLSDATVDLLCVCVVFCRRRPRSWVPCKIMYMTLLRSEHINIATMFTFKYWRIHYHSENDIANIY